MASAESLMKVQAQARENAAELKDYLKDLDSWQKDIKKKDITFKDMKPISQGKMVPPIRSGVHPKSSTSIKKEKLKSYDYTAWDKLDVDKLIEDIDEEDERIKSEKLEKQAEKLEKDLIKLSLEEKEKGNKMYKNGNYMKALECYTKGMQYDPTNAVLPANRAMTYLKLKKWVETEADCTLALSLNSSYVKAYLRRGTARLEMGKTESAEKDFKDVLVLEPDNKQAQSDLNKISKMGKKPEIVKSKEQLPAFVSKWKKSQRINAVIRPYNRRSKKPLIRLNVEEVSKLEDIKMLEDSEIIETKKDKISELPINQPLIEEVQTNDQMINSKTKPKVVEKEMTNFKIKTLPPIPKISSKFRSDLSRLLKFNSISDAFDYLIRIPPNTLPSIIKNDLDAELFEAIITSCKPNIEKYSDLIFKFLSVISTLRRFRTTLLCLTPACEQDLKEIFIRLSSQGCVGETSSLKELQKTYKCL